MHRDRLVALAGILFFAITGCASEETPPPVAQSPSPNVATSPVPVPNATQAPFATSPLVAQRAAPAPAVPGLIQPTNSQARGQQVETQIKQDNNRNPFAGLPPTLPQGTVTAKPVPKVAQLPANQRGGNNRSPQRANSPTQRTGTGNAGVGGNPGPTTIAGIPPQRAIGEAPTIPRPEGADEGAIGTYIPPVRPALPPAPTADAAQAIEVTGVVQVGRTAQAIVQSPDEPSSRYVSVGQRISNGKVLVKRIDMNAGGEPVVIFEQNGIEVARSVGERATPKPEKVS